MDAVAIFSFKLAPVEGALEVQKVTGLPGTALHPHYVGLKL